MNKLTKKVLLCEYKKNSSKIRRRLKEFSKNRALSVEKKFVELCFCICTPQSQAKKVAEVINDENCLMLLESDKEFLENALKSKTRFHKNKSRYIIHARAYLKDLKNLSEEPSDAREFLVANIKGIGYKEASHFLRNMGYRNICIIDRHVIRLMNELNVFKNALPPKNPKQYLEMEHLMKKYATSVGIDVDELDLLLWSIKTGYIFK